MPLFSRSRRGEIDQKLLSKIRNELKQKYSEPVQEREFVSDKLALEVLTRDRVGDLLRPLAWYREDYRDQIYPRMAIILCILITSDFERWSEFKSIFFHKPPGFMPKVLDKDLPLEDVSILPDYLQTSFDRQQYTFSPIIIEKDTHKEYNVKRRLPILKAEPIANTGSQGDVDKVYIEKGYLQFGPHLHNTEVRVMARKRIPRETRRGQKSFSTEKNNLEQFKRSLTNHSNIMQSFASFVYGPDFVILSEWADGQDLHEILYHPDLVWDDWLSRSSRFSPHNLLTEAYALAEALNFLHHHMVNNQGARYKCAHLDLKPENILVCIPESGNPSDAPVGRWKISDFGLSNVELSVARGELIHTPPATEHVGGLAPGTLIGEMSLRPLKRGPGPFQPPEVRDAETAKVSTRRDVWSFGCILVMVLAFALGGPEEVAHQQQLRSKGADDYFYVRTSRQYANNPFRASGIGLVDAEVKPDIVSWLHVRAPGLASQHSQWVQLCSTLVLRLLEVDVVRRPEMNQAVADLSAILTYTVQYRVWDFDASTMAPEPVQVIPDMPVTPDTESTGSHGPFVGVPTGTSPSSTPDPSSPLTNRSRSTLSIIAGYKADALSHYIRFQPVPHCTNATLCPSGRSAVFWTGAKILLYDLSFLIDENEIWQQAPPRPFTWTAEQTPLSICWIGPTMGFECQKVLVNGPYLAVLELARPRTYAIQIYSRMTVAEGQPISFVKRVSKPLASPPDDFRLSVQGSCLMKFPSKISFITLAGATDMDTKDADVMGFDFTGDGRAFCIWLRDGGRHYWIIRDSAGKNLGPPIEHAYAPSQSRPQAREGFLIPFSSYPRFIACDKHGRVFLVCADYVGEKVRRLCRTENVFTAYIFPSDDSFLLILASEHGRQKLQRINLSSMSDRASFQPYDCGSLPKNIDKNVSGICVRPLFSNENGQCLLTLSPSGILSRKTFSR